MKRPLIVSEPFSEFGPTTVTQDQLDRGVSFEEDMTYVPGWSDLKQKREAEMMEYKAGTRQGEDVSYLPGNLYLSRCQSIGGTVDARKLMSAKNAGYRPVTMEDVGKPWFRELPIGATVKPDGSIINAAGDYQYMWLEGVAAANRAKKKENAWLAQSGNIAMGREEKQGGDPIGREIRGADGKSVVEKTSKAKSYTKSSPVE